MTTKSEQKQYDVAIIGAGIIGVTSAEALSAKGLSVLVIDNNAQAASETSRANGGLITPGMSEPWASAGMPKKMLGWLGKEDAPALLRLKAIPGMVPWGIAFLKNCTSAKWQANAARMAALGCYSRECLLNVAEKYGLQKHVDLFGSLRVFRDQKTAEATLPDIEFMCQHGIRCNTLTAQECVAHEPALKHMQKDIVAAYYYPDDMSGDCCQFTRELANALQQQVKFVYSTNVRTVNKNAAYDWQLSTDKGNFKAKNIVFATGFAPTKLIGKAANKLLCYPVKGYSQSYKVAENAIGNSLKTPVLDDAIKIGIAPLGDQLRVVGTAEFCGYNTQITATRVNALKASAQSLLPELQDFEVVHNWACCRPMTPDGVPYVGELEAGTYANIGHGSLGWTNACGAAALLADTIAGDPTRINKQDYVPRSF